MRQLKQFKKLEIQPRKQVINYFLTLHVGTTKPDRYGNVYSILRGYINGAMVITLGATYGSGASLIHEALGKLNLPRFESALLELGVHLTVHRRTIKHKELKDYSDWCAV